MFLGMKPEEKSVLSRFNAMTQSRHTFYMLKSANNNFINGVGLYYREIGNFTKHNNIYDETNAVNSEYDLDLKKTPWVMEL